MWKKIGECCTLQPTVPTAVVAEETRDEEQTHPMTPPVEKHDGHAPVYPTLDGLGEQQQPFDTPVDTPASPHPLPSAPEDETAHSDVTPSAPPADAFSTPTGDEPAIPPPTYVEYPDPTPAVVVEPVAPADPVRAALAALDIDTLSPREAQEALYNLKALAEGKEAL